MDLNFNKHNQFFQKRSDSQLKSDFWLSFQWI